ncbi:MAG TPA: ATP-binding protein [Flexilinea sp.]|nr:ATP-binding protein [Flexilinea sp.]
MRQKIFRNMVLLAVLSVLIMAVLITFVQYEQFYREMRLAVKNSAISLSDLVNSQGTELLDLIQKSPDANRITLVDTDGTVLFDNKSDPAKMENHLDRPEIQAAIKNGRGESERLSETLSEITYYYAVKLDDGNILRISRTRQSVWAAVFSTIPYFILIIGIILIMAIFLARKLTKNIIDPLNNLNLDDPLSNEHYDELSPLISRIYNQQQEIQSYVREVREKQEEFNSVVNNMREGLIILNANANIMTINRSVGEIFDIEPENYIGKKIYTLHRSSALQSVIEKAMKGFSGEEVIEVGKRHFQLFADPVKDENQLKGIVLLILDVTEKKEAESNRREFTANVSHELKTPLTSIRGYAEIIRDGIVKPEDIPEFSDRIYKEADRMLEMVNDIMSLSHLDEGLSEEKYEETDLFKIVTEVAEKFKPMAAKKNIQILTEGETSIIWGVPRLIYEIVYNLVDNAIKYNRERGTVRLSVKMDRQFATLRVSDTGIGISKEDQARVFERFYRVDQSHNRDSGGTGLGLSIVKHAAMVHRAKVELSSQINVGTTITVSFPIRQS